MTVYINGKFTAQTTTGVQRVATSLLLALDALPGLGGRDWVLVHPRGARPPRLQNIRCLSVGPAGLPLHAWEQLALPCASRNGLLLNLSGTAPALARWQACQVHDAAVFDCPLTYTVAFKAWYKCLYGWLARRRAHFLTVSHYSRQRLAQHLGLAASAIEVLGNGSDHLDAVDPDPGVAGRLGLAGQRYLLAVATDSPGKNLPRLLQAYSRLPAGLDCHLVLVGGRNRAVFRPGAGPDAADPPGVVRAGWVSDAELKALYLGAMGLIVPSLYEGFGLPVVEAMRLGCPVVASTAAALPEVCAGAALAVDPLSVGDMADAMARLLRDPGLRASLRQAGLARSAGLTWQRSALRLQQFVDRVVPA